jgi:LuxR family transcriptional regulator, maltose regulon positive regulatory protein
MAMPPVVGTDGAAVERDALLATKLNVPVPGSDLVLRPRLAERLDEGLGRGVVLVCAPAGYGKTVLLADWARHAGFPVAWLSVDEGDNDPTRFWRHTVAALDRARPGIAARVSPLLGPPPPPSFDMLVTALINELAAQSDAGEELLVLDDYHMIDSPLVHASLGFLLEHRPPGLHVMLSSRSDPPLALARLRARGQLAEVRAADLRFTAGEAAALLAQVAARPGSQLPEEAVAALAGRTEGWAAGLRLAGLSLRGQSDVAGFVAAFTGSHRYVLDFLAEEVLQHQDEQVRAFLLETSVLERLSGQLCDAVTGRAGSQALLELIERAGLFLVPLDEVRGWWRYHQLFADVLRARLLDQQPAQAARLHHNAASWCQEHGLADDAIQHAAAAGEWTWAARLVEQHFTAVWYLRGEAETIRRWLAILPADLVRSRPRLLLAQAGMAMSSGDLAAVEPLLDQAEHTLADADEEPFEPTAGPPDSALVNIRALLAALRGGLAAFHDDAEAAAMFTSRAQAELGEGETQLSVFIHQNRAVVAGLQGRLAEAERTVAPVVAAQRAAGLTTTAAWGGYHLAYIQRAQGRLDAAARTAQEVLEITAPPGRPPLPAAGPGYVVLAELAYQRNELDTALRQVIEGIALCPQFVYSMPLAGGLATLAWIRQAIGDPAGALAAIGEAMRAAPGPPSLYNQVPAQRARLLLAQGDLAAAASWVQDCGLGADDEPDYRREQGHLVLARVLLAQALPARALALLDRLHAAAAAQGRIGSIIEIGALQALALAATGDQPAALDALAAALALACPRGHVRVFADEGPPMAALLGALIAAQRSDRAAARVPLGCLARLQRAFDAKQTVPDPGRAAVAVPALAEQLTSRELEVLTMLTAGRSNQAIAAELVVTLDTVKKHVSHVLAKLGAASRTEAVARARELSLIPW